MTTTKTSHTDIPRKLRGPILDAVLGHVPFDGWSDKAVKAAARDLDLDAGMVELAYPGGVREMIAEFSTRADKTAAETLQKKSTSDMKIRDRVALAVRLRIEVAGIHREAARHALSYLALPPNAAAGAAMTWRTADALWRAVGDKSTDVNYYSKRTILAGVFSAVVVYWLNDDSEGHSDTWAFLDRRINDVMKIEKAKARVKDYTRQMPDLVRMLGRLRYPHPSGKHHGQRG